MRLHLPWNCQVRVFEVRFSMRTSFLRTSFPYTDLTYVCKIMHGHLDFPSDAFFATPAALGFTIRLSRFTNSGVKTIAANTCSAFE